MTSGKGDHTLHIQDSVRVMLMQAKICKHQTALYIDHREIIIIIAHTVISVVAPILRRVIDLSLSIENIPLILRPNIQVSQASYFGRIDRC